MHNIWITTEDYQYSRKLLNNHGKAWDGLADKSSAFVPYILQQIIYNFVLNNDISYKFNLFPYSKLMSSTAGAKSSKLQTEGNALFGSAVENKQKIIVCGSFGNFYNKRLDISSLFNFKGEVVFFGLSLVKETLSSDTASQNKKFFEDIKLFEPIGCSDYWTLEYLRKLGIPAYFSGPITLMMRPRFYFLTAVKHFLIDLDFHHSTTLYKSCSDNSVETDLTCKYSFYSYPPDADELAGFKYSAHKVLEVLYTRAKDVITSNFPLLYYCLACGIPVNFVSADQEQYGFEQQMQCAQRILGKNFQLMDSGKFITANFNVFTRLQRQLLLMALQGRKSHLLKLGRQLESWTLKSTAPA